MRKSLVVMIVAAVLCCCSYGTDAPVESDNSHTNYSGRQYIKGTLNFYPTMRIDRVSLALLDSNCNVKRTLEPPFDSAGFRLDSVWLKEPYIKVVVNVALDSSKGLGMEFVQYADSSFARGINVNIMAALSSDMMEKSVCEDGLNYFDARDKAYHAVGRFFGVVDDGARVHFDGLDYNAFGNDPYIYGRYFISDSVFYADYKKMATAISKGEFGDSAYRTRAADNLVKSFKMDHWEGVRGMYKISPSWTYPPTTGTADYYIEKDVFPDFWENAYGFPYCTDKLLGDTIVNRTFGSAYYDTTFVCDRRHGAGGDERPHWRLIGATERVHGLCLSTTQNYAEVDSNYYVCSKDQWELVTDLNVILNIIYGTCDRWYGERLRTYRDTVYMCFHEDYKDTVYESVILDRTRYFWTSDTNIIDSVYAMDPSCIAKIADPCDDVDPEKICGKCYYCVNHEWVL